MKKTYLVKDELGEVTAMCGNLWDAKQLMAKYYTNGSILMLEGQYYGEGWHKYKLGLVNGKWKRKKLR